MNVGNYPIHSFSSVSWVNLLFGPTVTGKLYAQDPSLEAQSTSILRNPEVPQLGRGKPRQAARGRATGVQCCLPLRLT
jgi:hypothetical protein